MIIRSLDKLSLVLMALGVALMLQPWFAGGFEAGFFVTIASTLLQVATSHVL